MINIMINIMIGTLVVLWYFWLGLWFYLSLICVKDVVEEIKKDKKNR